MMEPTDGLPTRQRRWAIFCTLLTLTLTVLDSSLVNVALPTIAHDLDVSASTAIWVINAYQLALIMTLLPLASLGDGHGYRGIFIGGLVIYTGAALISLTATSLPVLIFGRVLQGIGASGIFSVNSAILRYIYPRAWLGRGIGINAFVIATSSAFGPTVAGVILSVASWHWLFGLSLPLGLIALLATPNLPQSIRSRHRFDYASALLNACTFGLFILGLGSVALGGILGYAELGGAVVAGALLVARQLTRPFPLLPVDLLKLPLFAVAAGTSVCSYIAFMVAYVALPFHFAHVLGRSPVETGMLMTPWPLLTGMIGPISGWLSERHSSALLCASGLTLFGVSLLLLTIMPASASNLDIAWRMALAGASWAIFQAPNNRAMINSAPRERSGGASGILGTARTLGLTTGASVAAFIFHLWPDTGTVVALAVGAAVAIAAAAVSLLRGTARASPSG
jgi:MFS transporter, DHA2 family, multidrug resistance protein